MSSARRPAVGFIFVTLVLDILGIGLIIPILPKLIEQLQGGNTAVAAHTVALLSFLFAAMQFVCAPILGCLSDQFGRRPVILGSLFGAGLDYLLLAWAPTVPWFFVGRVVAGVSASNLTAASAYIADISPPEKRAANFGIIGAAFGVGFVLGPVLGGWLGEYSLRLPFLVSAGLVFANWLYGFFVLPESLALENRGRFSWVKANPVGSLAFLGRHRLVLRLALALFLVNMAQFILHNVWVLYTGHRYAWTAKQVGLSLALVGVLGGLVQAVLARRVVPLLGEGRALLLGIALGVVSFIGYGLAPTGLVVCFMLVIGCLGGIGQPATQSLISGQVGPDEQGALQGALMSLTSVAQMIAPLLGGWTLAWGISGRAPIQVSGIPFFVGAALMVVGGLLAWAALKRLPPKALGKPLVVGVALTSAH